MDAMECIKSRQSIRKFTEQEVDPQLLREVINAARWSPSYKNSQPWQVMVLSGARKEQLSARLVELLKSGQDPQPDLAAPTSWPPAEEANIAKLLKQRQEAMGIDLSDPAIIKKAKEANFNFYGAPIGIYLYQESSLTSWSLFDLGLFAQSLMLAAHAKGLATVPQAFATDYGAETKDILGIPASMRLVLGLSLGYPDLTSPANQLRTERAEIDEFVQWLE
ncbi:MAG: nitroreductase [Thermodesulfobacteriota bacterium]